MPPANFPNEPPSEPPFLNPTASWYLGDARILFEMICRNCDLPTAKFIFQRCVEEAVDQEEAQAAANKHRESRLHRPPIRLPSTKQIDAADRHQICVWWARLRGTDQAFSESEKIIIHHLAGRYVDLGGYTKDFDETKLPPIPQKRNHADEALLVMFDRTNPQSAYSIEREKRGGKLRAVEFAASLVPEFGTSAGHIIRKVKYLRIGR